MRLNASEIAKILKVSWLGAWRGDREFTKISTDTRTLQPGDIYLALRGERFDGNHFARDASDKGAGALILEKSMQAEFAESKVPVMFVEEGLRALGDLAAHWRRRFNIPVIGLTGSNGKTTTRAILGSLLSERFCLHQTTGNLNNLVGLPQTVLELEAKHEVALFEMGMNHAGEIARLTEIAQPTIGLITNVSGAHLEYFAGVEKIAEAKGELFLGLDARAQALVNVDDPYCSSLASRAKISQERQISFGWQKTAQVMIERRETLGEKGSQVWISDRRGKGEPRIFEVMLPLPGDHNIYNLLAAVTCALVLGLQPDEIRSGVGKFKPVGSRTRLQSLPGGIHLIDDCYNANPTSMKAALQLLQQLAAGNAVAILGEMLELGSLRLKEHQELGSLAASFGLKALFVLGESANEVRKQAIKGGMKENQIRTYGAEQKGKPADELIQQLSHDLKPYLTSNTWILLKGSRGMALERLIPLLSKGN